MLQYHINLAGKQLETDSEGYLLDSQLWTADVAIHIASLENIEMTEERWQVINFVREFYNTYDTSPAIRALVKSMQNTYGIEKGNSRYLYRLFPQGPAKLASKLAGLPKPARCL